MYEHSDISSLEPPLLAIPGARHAHRGLPRLVPRPPGAEAARPPPGGPGPPRRGSTRGCRLGEAGLRFGEGPPKRRVHGPAGVLSRWRGASAPETAGSIYEQGVLPSSGQ
jgi:hypothetical protein